MDPYAPVAFQFPSPIDGCDCLLCTRQGVDKTAYVEPRSVFESYELRVIEFPVGNRAVNQQPPQPKVNSPEQDDILGAAERMTSKYRFMTSTLVQKLPWFDVCSFLLRSLIKEKESRIFRAPVDWIKLNIPTYPQYIKHPMDLGTIDRFLHNSPCIYTNPDDFVSDVRLVFRNAYIFNPEGHDVRNLARKLSLKFETELYSYHQPSQ